MNSFSTKSSLLKPKNTSFVWASYVLLTLLFVFIFNFMVSSRVYAVRNNNGGIRSKTLRGLESHNQNVTSSYVNNIGLNSKVGPLCRDDPKRWHFQDAWISPKNQSTVTTITIDEGSAASAALQYNILGGTCHRIFGTSSPSTAL